MAGGHTAGIRRLSIFVGPTASHETSRGSHAERRCQLPTAPHPRIGIDLGTTYSAIAYLDETGRPTTLANSLGDLLTLSAVLVDRHEIVVGREAAKASAVEPQSHASALNATSAPRCIAVTCAVPRFRPKFSVK